MTAAAETSNSFCWPLFVQKLLYLPGKYENFLGKGDNWREKERERERQGQAEFVYPAGCFLVKFVAEVILERERQWESEQNVRRLSPSPLALLPLHLFSIQNDHTDRILYSLFLLFVRSTRPYGEKNETGLKR